jgi:hypothetical protein
MRCEIPLELDDCCLVKQMFSSARWHDLQYYVLKCRTHGVCISVTDILRLPIALQTDHATGTRCASMPRSPTESLSIPTSRRPLQEHIRRDDEFLRLNAAFELFQHPPSSSSDSAPQLISGIGLAMLPSVRGSRNLRERPIMGVPSPTFPCPLWKIRVESALLFHLNKLERIL